MTRTPPTFQNDPDLEASGRGDRQAFRRVVERHYSYAYRLAFRTLRSIPDAEDVVQETFIKVWDHLPRFDRSARFTTWMYTIVANLCIDRLRRRERWRSWMRPEGYDWENAKDPVDAVQHHETQDLADIIRSLAGKLSPVQRIVFALRDLEDLDIAEVAAITGLSIGSVKTNLSYARRRIRTYLDTEYGITGLHQ